MVQNAIREGGGIEWGNQNQSAGRAFDGKDCFEKQGKIKGINHDYRSK